MSPLRGDRLKLHHPYGMMRFVNFTQPHRGDIFVAPSLRDIILLQVSFIPAGYPSPKKVSLHEFAKESHGIIHHGAVFIGVEHIQ